MLTSDKTLSQEPKPLHECSNAVGADLRVSRSFSQIAGPSFRKHRRGLPLTLRAEVSSPLVEDDNVVYTWTVVSESPVTSDVPPLTLTIGRNPSVLVLPPFSLGYAGSTYVFRVDRIGHTQRTASALATGRLVSQVVLEIAVWLWLAFALPYVCNIFTRTFANLANGRFGHSAG